MSQLYLTSPNIVKFALPASPWIPLLNVSYITSVGVIMTSLDIVSCSNAVQLIPCKMLRLCIKWPLLLLHWTSGQLPSIKAWG